MIAKRLKVGLSAAIVAGTLGFASAPTVKNIVLVHGAWVDGSGWKPVYEILVKDGYTVTVVQEPLTSFADDVAATRRALAQQDGPCILVAHSYGGSVISEAGIDPHVVGLVYIAAHMPDAGESEAADGARYPSALSTSNVKKTTSDGYTYIDPVQFSEILRRRSAQAAGRVCSPVTNLDRGLGIPRHGDDARLEI